MTKKRPRCHANTLLQPGLGQGEVSCLLVWSPSLWAGSPQQPGISPPWGTGDGEP